MSEAMPNPPGPGDGAGEDALNRDETLRLLEDGGTSLGEVLRRRREAMGVSVKEVALRLDVSSEQIVAVERDDYARFAAPIYARSFLRRYAEVLGLPVEPVLAAYERLAHPEPPPLKRVSLREQVHSGHPSLRWTTYLLLLLLAILVGVWWWSMRQPPASPSPVPVEPLITQPLTPDDEQP